MASESATYDLVLLLDLSATDAVRAQIVADTKATIESSGQLVTDQDWGARPLAYEIGRSEQAEYHLFQFEGPGSLPESLARTLRITDGVIRHRIIKRPAPGAPRPASAERPAGGQRAARAERAGGVEGSEQSEGRDEGASAESTAEPAPAA